MTLLCLIITFKPEGVEIRTLYRSKNGPNPGRKSRAREVRELARTGLREAMEALEDYVDVIGTSGYQVREDTISVGVPEPEPPKELGAHGPQDRSVRAFFKRFRRRSPGEATEGAESRP